MKSRMAMADACWMACKEIYENGQWVDAGEIIPTVFISVELDCKELQTMALSFIANVPEDKIIHNTTTFEEQERIEYALQMLEDNPREEKYVDENGIEHTRKIQGRSALYIEYLPDYRMIDIENCIKRNLRVNKCKACFLDYIATSMKMIEEVAKASSGMKVREDQILYLLSSKIKDIATKFGVFIFSSTQLSAQFKTEPIPDQTLLAGAKAIANRIDFGCIALDMLPEDYEAIDKAVLSKNPSLGHPNLKMSIYKNRRGKTNRVLLWMNADKGTCRYKTLFVTDYNLNLLDVCN